MARGFGSVQPKQRSSRKSVSQKLQKNQTNSQQRSTEIRKEIKDFLEQDRQKNPHQHTLAWLAGVYNPLGEGAEDNARFLETDEEEWLFLAKEVGWLQVEDELDAIYFTAPPPNFDPAQADWYVRPDLTTCLEEPESLKEAIAKYPISAELMKAAIARYTQPLGWNTQRIEAFIRETTGRSSAEMEIADCTIVLLELGRL